MEYSIDNDQIIGDILQNWCCIAAYEFHLVYGPSKTISIHYYPIEILVSL